MGNCCKAMTDECLACIEEFERFCRKHQNDNLPGCQRSATQSWEPQSESAFGSLISQVASKAMASDQDVAAEDRTNDYLKSHPHTAAYSVADFGHDAFGALSAFSNMFSQQEMTSPNHDQKEPAEEVSAESQDEQEIAEDKWPRSSALSFQNPWVVSICALLITGVCSGIAMGSLCR